MASDLLAKWNFKVLTLFSVSLCQNPIFHYCHMITKALKELEAEGFQLTQEILDALSPYRTHHIN